jgi:hypothetical protein
MNPDGDQLWDQNKMVAVSPKPSPNKYFALHELIQSPDTHSANTSELLDKVERLLRIYPRYLTITNKQNLTAHDLLIAQLQSAHLTTLARSNFEAIKALLESSIKQ